MSKNLFAELRATRGYLTRVERILAEFILKDPYRFISLTMSELAEAAGVSQGSINNFARKFSSGGFSALKQRIADLLSDSERDVPRTEEVHGVRETMQHKLLAVHASLSSTLELNDEQTLKTAVRLILRAQKLVIYGIFHSAIVGRYLCYRLIQLGLHASFADDTLMCAVSAATLGEQDLVFAISSSGRTSDIINAVEFAKENRTPVICLTCNRFSPLARLSDSVLISSSDVPGPPDKTADARMAQLFVIDSLCAYLEGVIRPGDRIYREKVLKIVNSHSIRD